MECRKCGYIMERNLDFRPKYELINNYKKENRSIPRKIIKIYKDYNYICQCENCKEIYDYNDIPYGLFFSWLGYSSVHGDSREASGKAFIRYFKLDKLLKLKRKRGWFK